MDYKELKIAVCDDRTEEREIIIDMLAGYLDLHDYVASIDQFSSGEEILSADVSVYKLIILDIFMDQINGIETARKLLEMNSAAQIIFCSTSNEFASESYDVFALRYLTKPVKEDKLYQTLDRFFHWHTSLRTLNYKQNRMDESVYLSEVLWIEAGDHKSVIHTKNSTITTGTQFKDLCEQLSDVDFVKPIRYALVSLAAVVEIPTDVLNLVDGSVIPVSRASRTAMREAFSEFKRKQLMRKGGLRL